MAKPGERLEDTYVTLLEVLLLAFIRQADKGPEVTYGGYEYLNEICKREHGRELTEREIEFISDFTGGRDYRKISVRIIPTPNLSSMKGVS